MNQTPEQIARDEIDRLLELAGWTVVSKSAVNLSASKGVAVREYQTGVGPADYVLFVDKTPVGVIEAKREDEGFKLHHTGPTLLRHLQERYNRTVIIHTSGGSHPEGRYSIPYKVLSDFIVLKTELPCWKNYGFWTQTKVPAALQQYFTSL